MPANKLTQMETEIFIDIAHGSQSAIMEFLFIRNKLLQAWLADPAVELTTEKAQAAVILPQAGQSLLITISDTVRVKKKSSKFWQKRRCVYTFPSPSPTLFP